MRNCCDISVSMYRSSYHLVVHIYMYYILYVVSLLSLSSFIFPASVWKIFLQNLLIKLLSYILCIYLLNRFMKPCVCCCVSLSQREFCSTGCLFQKLNHFYVWAELKIRNYEQNEEKKIPVSLCLLFVYTR